jgi:CBS domain-containing protein
VSLVTKRESNFVLESADSGVVVADLHPSANSVVTESVVNFLKDIPPFQFLSSPELAKLARSMALEYFPKNSVVLRVGQRAAEALYVVQKGAVKLAVRTQVGKELVLDMRSEGELFGVLSLMSGDVARLDVVAVEDTLCYTIPMVDVQRLMAEHSEFADYLVRTSVRRYMDRSLRELRSQTHLMGDSERLLYSLTVNDVVNKVAVTCSEQTSIRDAATLVADSHAASVIVADEAGRPIGIVTESDFTRKVLARGIGSEVPVKQIMSSPVIAVESSALVFQALLEMLTHDIQHVLVTELGTPRFVLTSHDLMLLQGKSPLSVARHLEQQKDLQSIGKAQQRAVELLPLLLREGAKASHLTRVVSEINDRLVVKIFELAHQKLGPAPTSYCWVVLGSEGRREQTFKTDQDNALIYSDDADNAAIEYFERLTQFINDGLKQCGYPDCEGGYMAKNPRWRQSLGSWQNTFAKWMNEGELHATEDALIFFDMRPVAGDPKLFQQLAGQNRERLKHAGFFKSILASISIEHKPPLGFFRTFVLEHSGEHKRGLDIKMFGTGPIVNAARLFALDAGIEATNTLDRLVSLQPIHYLDDALLRDLQHSFEFLTLLRLEQQLQQSRSGQPMSNYVAPEKLTPLQKSMLKDTFQTIARVQSFIDQRFRTAVWTQMGR